MLRRAASSLVARAAGLRRLPPPPMTTAAMLVQHHQEPRLATPAPLPRLGGAGARGYARMARRIPPAWRDGYSSSDGEADACGDGEEADLEAGAAADGDENVKVEWLMLDLGGRNGADEDNKEENATDEKKQRRVGGGDPAFSKAHARRLRKCLKRVR